tara:strand:- start:424 stop:1281 length:858 start_codon:yes stop_codon:yes gene_type:complete
MRDGSSVLVKVLSAYKLMDDHQKSLVSKLVLNFIEGWSGQSLTLNVADRPMSPGDFSPARDQNFFRLVSSNVANYLKQGKFRFCTPKYYRELEDEGRADVSEGYSCIFIEGTQKCLQAAATSGFNCLVLCGFGENPRDGVHSYQLQQQFDEVLIEITDVESFTSIVQKELLRQKKIKCFNVHTMDIYYHSGKFISLNAANSTVLENCLQKLAMHRELPKELLHDFNMQYWDSIYEATFWPSVFSKPERYAHEKERRIAFECSLDIEEDCIHVEIPEALEFLKFYT